MVASSKIKALKSISTECAFTIFMAELNQKIELTHATYRVSGRGGLQL